MGFLDRQIQQIIPADDWYALHWADDEPYYCLFALACFALVQDEEMQYVVGLDAADTVDWADECSSFYAYVRKDEVDDEEKAQWSKEGKQRAEVRRKAEEAQALVQN
jgi:hypothetical protein